VFTTESGTATKIEKHKIPSKVVRPNICLAVPVLKVVGYGFGRTSGATPALTPHLQIRDAALAHEEGISAMDWVKVGFICMKFKLIG